MRFIADLLREGDPVVADAEMSEGDARRMCQLLLAHHADGGGQAAVLWRGVAVLASIAVLAIALGARLSDGRVSQAPGVGSGLAVATATEPPPARQVQFVTPRGTRVVWVLRAETPGQEGIR